MVQFQFCLCLLLLPAARRELRNTRPHPAPAGTEEYVLCFVCGPGVWRVGTWLALTWIKRSLFSTDDDDWSVYLSVGVLRERWSRIPTIFDKNGKWRSQSRLRSTPPLGANLEYGRRIRWPQCRVIDKFSTYGHDETSNPVTLHCTQRTVEYRRFALGTSGRIQTATFK